MSILAYRLRRQTACSLLMFMALPFAALAQQAVPNQQANTSSGEQAQTSTRSPSENMAPAGPQTDPQQSTQTSAQPVGTAAAPYENPSGVGVSSPAGAVIAPAKQRRAHSFLIKLGLIVGGAAAIGTVVALSRSSSSRPN